MSNITIGEKIRKIRELKGLAPKLMADKLKMTPAGYSKIERGETDIAFSKLEEIASALGVSTEDMIGFDQQRFFNHQNNVKGDNNGIIITDMSKEVKKLYEDKISLLEQLLKTKTEHLTRYQEKFGDV